MSGVALTPLEATTIAHGIYTDTGGLTYPSTGAADARAVAYLLEQGADVQIISDLGSLEALAWLERQRNTIVVAPSLVDNLPYAVIELFARRLPLISSRIGGIPEIIGESNPHVLAEPTADSLADALSRAHRDGHLTIDYGAGYSIERANAAHLACVHRMIEGFRKPARSFVDTFDVVVVDAAEGMLQAARERIVAADATAARGTFRTWASWCRGGAGRAAIFMAADVTPRAGITIPIPGAADVGASVQDNGSALRKPQPMQHIKPGEARSDDHGVQQFWSLG